MFRPVERQLTCLLRLCYFSFVLVESITETLGLHDGIRSVTELIVAGEEKGTMVLCTDELKSQAEANSLSPARLM